MGFEVEYEETFAVGEEGNKIPRYIVEATDEDFYVRALKTINDNGVEFSFSWPTERQVYDYAKMLQKEYSDCNFDMEVFYLDQGEVHRAEISIGTAADGWNNIQIEDKEIAVYEINNALSEPREGCAIGWSQGIRSPKEMHLNFIQPNYSKVVDWIDHDKTHIAIENIEAIVETIENELDNYEFEKEVDEIEANDLLE